MHGAVRAPVLKPSVHPPVSVPPIVPRALHALGRVLPVLALPEAQLFVGGEFGVLREFEPVILPEPNRPPFRFDFLRHFQLAGWVDVPQRAPHLAGRHVDALGRHGARVHMGCDLG